uniref:Uncharacterized protein n=1 Tax=Ditylenchus dipsaci TaxID=166011 RepID=A0A915CPS0_9BILA
MFLLRVMKGSKRRSAGKNAVSEISSEESRKLKKESGSRQVISRPRINKKCAKKASCREETSTASQAKFTQDEMQCLRRAWTHEDEQVLQALWSEKLGLLAQRTVGDICPSIQEDEPDLHMEELIAFERTRLNISKKLYKHAEQERNEKKALRLHFCCLHIPRQFLDNEKKKRMASNESFLFS